MFVASLYNSVKNRIFVLVMVTGCIVRVVTNYLYGIHYLGPELNGGLMFITGANKPLKRC